MEIQAIIFDMDGVLVDSQLRWLEVQNDFLAGLVGTWGEEDQSRIIGMSIDDVHRLLVSEYGATVSRDEMLSYYQGLAGEIYGVKSLLLPGVKELIVQIKAEGFKLAVASSSIKSWIQIVLDRFELGEYFSAVVSSDDVGTKGKPAPDIYLKSCEMLEVSPGAAIAIEDSSKGIESAKAAGMFCLGLNNGFNQDQDLSSADAILNGFLNLQPKTLIELVS